MHKKFLASTILTRCPVAFAGTVTLIDPPNPGIVERLIAAAIAASDQQPAKTTEDLGKRDSDSAWMLEYWDLTDDIVEGYAAIKRRGDKYLPKFSDESTEDHTARLGATEFTNVYRDIVETLSSKPFEEEVMLVAPEDKTGKEVELPQPITDFCEDVDGAGSNLTSFAAVTFFNGINSAIDWIYVDYPVVDPAQVRTQADVKAQGIRPFWSHVLGRNVLEATSVVIGGKETLIKMRILEPGTPNHIRVFERFGNKVTWGSFEEKIERDTTKTYILVDSGTISIGVIPLIPFYTGRRDGRTFRFYPSMRDAADLQIQLYQQESGLKFAKIMSAYPMLAANGINPDTGSDGKPKKLAVGPNKVLWGKRDGAGNYGTWAYVQPDAAILTFLKTDVKETMDQLRELGRQPLTAQSGNLTVITTAYAAGKARTAVGAWALRLQDALENAMTLTCEWLNIPDTTYDPEIYIFDEFDDFTTDQASDQTALASLRATRDISRKALIHEQKRRDVLCADYDEEKDMEELLKETVSDSNLNVADDGAGNHPNGNPKFDAYGKPIDDTGKPLGPGQQHPAPLMPPKKPVPAKKAKR